MLSIRARASRRPRRRRTACPTAREAPTTGGRARHELAHALIAADLRADDPGLTHARAEVVANGVTYVVCGQLGLDTSGETIPYVAGWGEDGALNAIHADAQTIDEVARRTEKALIVEEQTVAA